MNHSKAFLEGVRLNKEKGSNTLPSLKLVSVPPVAERNTAPWMRKGRIEYLAA